MCGLIGVAGKIYGKEEQMFRDLLLLDTIRGKHSTGIASLHGSLLAPKYTVVKDSVNASTFMDSEEFRKAMAPHHHILMGHNRFATRGKIVQENAHPFEFDNVIGMHNGSLVSYSSFHNSGAYEVDSQALYSELDNSDASTMWGKLHGAAALTWIDKRTNQLYFLRNDERPLWWTTLNKGETLIWASEYWMIHVAAGRNGVDLDSPPKEVNENELYEFDVLIKFGEKITHTRRKVEPYVPPKKTWDYSGNYKSYLGKSYDDGGHFFTDEGCKEGEEIEFTVNKIEDYMDGATAKARIICTSLKGTPVRVYNMNVDEHDDLIIDMWEVADMVFSGKVNFATAVGLVLDKNTIKSTGYTISDIELAEEQLIEDMKKRRAG